MGLEKGCPCCKLYKDGLEFKKVMELEKAGLIIYRHTTPVNSVASVSQPEKAFHTKENVFIIHNTKNRNVSTSNYMSEFEQAINCPRCKYIVKHTKELLLNVPFIRKKDVIGICDHCRFAKRNNERCNKCQVFVEQFLRKQEQRQTETRDSVEQEKAMLSKIEHILKDAPKAVYAKSKTSPRSETSLKNLSPSYTKSPTYHVPRVKDMFDIQKKPEKYKQLLRKGFLKLIEPTKLYSNKSDSEITFNEAKRRKEHVEPRKKILFNSTEDIARPRYIRDSEQSLQESVESFRGSAEFVGLDKHLHRIKQTLKQKVEALKQQHRQPPSPELEEYLKKEHDSVSPVEYGTKKWPSEASDIHEKEFIKNINKYQYSYDDLQQSQYDQEVSKSTQKTEEEKFLRGLQKTEEEKYLRGLQKTEEEKFLGGLQKTEEENLLRGIQKSEEQFLRGAQKVEEEKFLRGIHKKEEEKILRGIQKGSISDRNIRRYSSEETLLKSASETTGHKLQKDFSYFFIKETDDVKKPPRKRVSSSELIKDTQDMYRARAEEERLKKEQELKEKLEAEEKKRLAKIERKKFLDEERRLEELKKKKAEDEKRRLKQLEERKDLHKEKPSKQDIESQEKSVKTSKEPSVKSKSIKIKPEKKESKLDRSIKSDKDSQKSKRDLDKQDKEEKMRLEKERKLKEKLEKEEQMRKANELKQRQKEDKDKEKRSKEDQMRVDKEEKQKQKEEKDREKGNKEEEMRKAKEEKQKQKEEKDREKANKEEEMRKAKEEKQREKEAKERQEAELRNEKEKNQREKEQRLKEKEDRQREKEENQRRKEQEEKENAEKQKQLEQQLTEAQKEKESKLKKKQEEKEKKQEAKLKLKSLKDAKPEAEPEKPQSNKLAEESKMKDLNINQIKVRKDSPDDLILQLVKLKQKQASLKERPTRMSQINIPPKVVCEHMGHKNARTDKCIICLDSDLELDIENIRLNETKSKEIHEVIVGEKIFKHKHSIVKKKEDKEIKPLFFSSTHTEGENFIKEKVPESIPEQKEKKPPIVTGKFVEQEVPKGIIRYALSDRTFIEKGWTMLPTEKVVRKMNVYRMRPAHPEFDWFEHNKSRKLISYDTGEKLAEFDDNGKGRWFYRSGKVALDYYDAEEINAQQRIVIFSSGEPDERGCSRPFAILATFDYLGNGIVFDHAGKIRLKYNQTEGVVLDRAIGPVSHWKWHTLNDPPVLQQVMIDTQMAHKDPDILKLGGPHDNKPRPDNEEMLAIEFDNFIKEKSKKLSQKFKPFQIKMKALKINEHFSLKVLDQATIYLIYRDGSTNLKLNIGMILDHQEIVDTDTAEVGEVSNSLQRFPARTDSLAGLQRSVAHAQRVERARAERARRLRPAQPSASADRLAAGLARPRPRLPDRASCPCPRPPTLNLYYDTRLI